MKVLNSDQPLHTRRYQDVHLTPVFEFGIYTSDSGSLPNGTKPSTEPMLTQ